MGWLTGTVHESSNALGFGRLNLHPYQLRRGGSSFDTLSNQRTLIEVHAIVRPPLRKGRQSGSDVAQRAGRSNGVLPASTGRHCGPGGTMPSAVVAAGLCKSWETQAILHKAL